MGRRGVDELESYGDRQAGALARRPFRTALKWAIALVVLVFIVAAIAGLLGWVSSWGGEAKRIAGPENAREQYTQLIGDYQDLEATVGNVCGATAAAHQPGADPTLIEDPAFAYKATYRRIKADYDRRMANAFEAGLIRAYPGLSKYPREAPTLEAAVASTCPQEGKP